MTNNEYIPIYYGFENCQFSCVSIRILHFLLIGFQIYYILNLFISTINTNFKTIEDKAIELEKLNISLKNEEKEKEAIKQKMLEAIISTEESERKRIASDLHDSLGPVLSAINLYFQAYIDAPDNEKEKIKTRLKQIINDAVNDVSRISHNISPYILESKGLFFAVNNFISDIKIKQNIEFQLDFDNLENLEFRTALTIYRIIIELINNTLKHANASQIILIIKIEDNLLKLVYSDNGKGFDLLKLKDKGIGLKSIENRINSENGSSEIITENNNGFKITVFLPYKNGKN